MRKSLFLVGIVFCLFACKNEPTATTETATAATSEPAAETNTQSSPVLSSEAIGSVVAPDMPVKGKAGAPVSGQTKRVVTAIANNTWSMVAYLRMALEEKERKKVYEENKGRWFQFEMDGNFVTGKWDETTGKGKWAYDPSVPCVYLDHESIRDEEFQVKMSGDEDVMIWIGTEKFGENGVQAKLENRVGPTPNPANAGQAVKDNAGK